jgi:hypothetical protein
VIVDFKLSIPDLCRGHFADVNALDDLLELNCTLGAGVFCEDARARGARD